MNPENAIEVHHLSKKFCRSLKRSMAYGALDVGREMIGFPSRTVDLRKSEFWALDDVSFQVKQGETLGILGLNGSGKSTLLRLVAGILPPDKGSIHIRGKLGSLIALGAGFHPHMTGRENIFLNGTILGMKRAEITRKLDSIVSFCDLDSFLDAPVATYSSGMIVRLGFSIAIHSDLNVMLIDEVLSVGDMSFQNKCLRKIYEKKLQGVSFLFVSHAVDTVRIVCDSGLLLKHGQVQSEGPIDKVIMDYNRIIRGVKQKSLTSENEDRYLMRSDSVQFDDLGLLSTEGSKTDVVQYGEDLKFFWEFTSYEDLSNVGVGIGIKDERAFNIVYAFSENYREVAIPDLKQGFRYRIEVVFKQPNIKPGVYGFNCVLINRKTDEVYLHALSLNKDGFRIESPQKAFIVDGDMYSMNAVIELPTKWKVTEISSGN